MEWGWEESNIHSSQIHSFISVAGFLTGALIPVADLLPSEHALCVQGMSASQFVPPCPTFVYSFPSRMCT